MNANTRYEIEAKAFKLMTGLTAPGKDSPVGENSTAFQERCEAWYRWKSGNIACINAMVLGFEYVTEKEL